MCFFFFKQKTAYEMRISDWSSDVCSSDLKFPDEIELALCAMPGEDLVDQFVRDAADARMHRADAAGHERLVRKLADADVPRRIKRDHRLDQIGRESCRERVCQYV